MIPGEFDYAAPDSVDGAVAALAEGGASAKLLAGGHSLLPLMKMRFAAPTLLVDLRSLAELRGADREDGGWRIGAMTTHADLQGREELGVVGHATSLIADQQVRNRGTIGGSLAHGDPVSDLPAVLLAAEGEVTARGPRGERRIAAAEMFEGLMTTALAPDEVLTEVHLPAFDGWSWGYEKFTRRSEDWAIVGVCALLKAADGVCEDVRVGLISMGPTPLRATAVEEALRGQPLDPERIAASAEQAAEGTSPQGDLNASPEYKRHLARVLCRRALTAASGL